MITVGVEPAPAENVMERLSRSNWHIGPPKTCAHEACHSRRGIWILRSSRCDRHFNSMPVRLQSMSDIRPAKSTTVPGLVSP